MLRTRRFLLWIACCLPENVTAFGQEVTPRVGSVAEVSFPGERWERHESPEAVGYDSAALERLTEFLSGLSTTGLLAVVEGRVLYEYGDLEQVSYVASVRKSILSMLYGKYVESGDIDLTATLDELAMDDVGGLLPIELEATVEDLISARSGVYHAASNPGDNLADAPPRGSQQPGEYYLYSNWDFNAAGAAFELQTGLNIYDALQRDLAVPLGMQDFDRSRHQKSGDPSRSRNMAYHMHFSTRDMARLGYLMLREGRWGDRQLVPRDWVSESVSVITPLEEMNPEGLRRQGLGYGYMWWVWDGPKTPDELRGAYSARGAFGQYITVIPEFDLVVAHKTAVPPERSTSWNSYRRVLVQLVKARSD